MTPEHPHGIIDPAHRNAEAAEDAKHKMEAAGLDPATIATVIDLILKGVPYLKILIDKLFHHVPAPDPKVG